MDFEAWFMSRRESDRSWKLDEAEWRFSYRFLPGIGSPNSRLAFPEPLLGPEPPDVLVSIYAQAPFVLGRMLTQVRGIRHAFYVEKTHENWVRRRDWKERLKRRLFSKADAMLVSGPDSRSYVASYGAAESRIFEVANGTDIKLYASASSLSDNQREALRSRFGLQGLTFAYAGRLWSGKGLYYLIDAFADLHNRLRVPMSLVIAGDGKDEIPIRKYAAQIGVSDVIFVGFLQRQQLAQIFGLSDVFVFPTLGDTYGMVVDEAMACGLPVISTSTCGEIRERVIEGITGYIVPPRDSAALCDRMARLGESPQLRAELGNAARLKIAPRTPDRWARQFEAAVQAILAMERSKAA